MSELIDFCKQGNVLGVRAWLRDNPQTSINRITDKNGTTAIMCASVRGHTGVVQALIQDGRADVNLQNKQGWTACIYASENGHVDTLRLLIESGADVNMESKDGITALKGAVYWGHIEAALLLIRSGANPLQKTSGTSALDNAQTESMRSAIVYAMYANNQESQTRRASVALVSPLANEESRTIRDEQADNSAFLIHTYTPDETTEQFVLQSPVHKGRDWTTDLQTPSMDDEVNTRLYDLEGQYGELLRLQQKTRGAQQVQIAELQATVDAQLQRIIELESIVTKAEAGVRNRMASLEARMEAWPDKIGSLQRLEESFNTQLEAIRSEYQQQLTALEIRNAFLMKQLVAVEAQSHSLQQRLAGLEDETKSSDAGTDFEAQLTRELHAVSRRVHSIERRKKKRWFTRPK